MREVEWNPWLLGGGTGSADQGAGDGQRVFHGFVSLQPGL